MEKYLNGENYCIIALSTFIIFMCLLVYRGIRIRHGFPVSKKGLIANMHRDDDGPPYLFASFFLSGLWPVFFLIYIIYYMIVNLRDSQILIKLVTSHRERIENALGVQNGPDRN